MHRLGRLRELAPNVPFDALTSEDIEAYLRSLIDRHKEGTVHPVFIKEAKKRLRVPMKLSDAGARMLEFVHDAFNRLESLGYRNFYEKNSKKMVKFLHNFV